MKTDDKPASPRQSLALPVLGLFIFYVAHDALQERAFRTPGFTFGWFMTLIEMVVVSACAVAFEWGPDAKALPPADLRVVRRCIVGLAVGLTVSQGSGSSALQYVNYPIKVAFKSSKLCPTMLFGVLFTKKSFSVFEYCAALLMCVGLAGLSLSDARGAETNDAHNIPLGCALLSLAVVSDALVPNLQEKVLKEYNYPLGRMIVLSNLGCTLVVTLYVLATGELFHALDWCQVNTEPTALLVLQACCTYAGLCCYLTVVRETSGVVGVVVTSLRKVVTLVLSFVLFEKPYGAGHVASLAVLAAGIALATYAKARR